MLRFNFALFIVNQIYRVSQLHCLNLNEILCHILSYRCVLAEVFEIYFGTQE